MTRTVRKRALPLLAALCGALALVALSACGYSSNSKDVVEGEPVNLGDVQYNVVFSRYLNPNDAEDAAYLTGQEELGPGYTYFGVFLEVQNSGDEAHSLPESLTITDADGTPFESLASESLYAFPLGGEVEPEEQVPVLDTTPQQGPIEGSLVLFKLPDSAGEARPLILKIPSPEGTGKVTLDL